MSGPWQRRIRQLSILQRGNRGIDMCLLIRESDHNVLVLGGLVASAGAVAAAAEEERGWNGVIGDIHISWS